MARSTSTLRPPSQPGRRRSWQRCQPAHTINSLRPALSDERSSAKHYGSSYWSQGCATRTSQLQDHDWRGPWGLAVKRHPRPYRHGLRRPGSTIAKAVRRGSAIAMLVREEGEQAGQINRGRYTADGVRACVLASVINLRDTARPASTGQMGLLNFACGRRPRPGDAVRDALSSVLRPGYRGPRRLLRCATSFPNADFAAQA
jgi:hypothetical protein